MINFFQNKNNDESNISKYSKIAALLIHAAKIDEVYEEKATSYFCKLCNMNHQPLRICCNLVFFVFRCYDCFYQKHK